MSGCGAFRSARMATDKAGETTSLFFKGRIASMDGSGLTQGLQDDVFQGSNEIGIIVE